jgi:hypothetical protein
MTQVKLVEDRTTPGQRRVSLSLSVDLIEVLEQLATKEGCSLEEYIANSLLVEALAYRVRRRT